MESQYRDEIQVLKDRWQPRGDDVSVIFERQEVMKIYEFLEVIKDNNVKIGNIVYF